MSCSRSLVYYSRGLKTGVLQSSITLLFLVVLMEKGSVQLLLNGISQLMACGSSPFFSNSLNSLPRWGCPSFQMEEYLISFYSRFVMNLLNSQLNKLQYPASTLASPQVAAVSLIFFQRRELMLRSGLSFSTFAFFSSFSCFYFQTFWGDQLDYYRQRRGLKDFLVLISGRAEADQRSFFFLSRICFEYFQRFGLSTSLGIISRSMHSEQLGSLQDTFANTSFSVFFPYLSMFGLVKLWLTFQIAQIQIKQASSSFWQFSRMSLLAFPNFFWESMDLQRLLKISFCLDQFF